MQAEVKIVNWKTERIKNKMTVTGEYELLVGKKKIASQTFNGEYSGVAIAFSRETTDLVKQITENIVTDLEASFDE